MHFDVRRCSEDKSPWLLCAPVVGARKAAQRHMAPTKPEKASLSHALTTVDLLRIFVWKALTASPVYGMVSLQQEASWKAGPGYCRVGAERL